MQIFDELNGYVADDDFIDEVIYMAQDRYGLQGKQIDEVINYIEDLL